MLLLVAEVFEAAKSVAGYPFFSDTCTDSAGQGRASVKVRLIGDVRQAVPAPSVLQFQAHPTPEQRLLKLSRGIRLKMTNKILNINIYFENSVIIYPIKT